MSPPPRRAMRDHRGRHRRPARRDSWATTGHGGSSAGAPTRPTATDPALDPPSAYCRPPRRTLRRRCPVRQAARRCRASRWFGAWVPTFDQGAKWGARETAAKVPRGGAAGRPRHCRRYRHLPGSTLLRSTQALQAAADGRAQICRSTATWVTESPRRIGRLAAVIIAADRHNLPFTARPAPRVGRRSASSSRWTVSQFCERSRQHDRLHRRPARRTGWTPCSAASRCCSVLGVASRHDGFRLDLAHFDSPAPRGGLGKKVVAALARVGRAHPLSPLNTSMNGRRGSRPSAHWHELHAPAPSAGRCGSRDCVTLGQPPTTETGAVLVVTRSLLRSAGRGSSTSRAAPTTRCCGSCGPRRSSRDPGRTG